MKYEEDIGLLGLSPPTMTWGDRLPCIFVNLGRNGTHYWL